MELCGLKKQPIWLWWAIDRRTHRIAAWALGDRGAQTAQVLQQQLPEGTHIEFCTDYHKPYVKILANRQHRVGKALMLGHSHVAARRFAADPAPDYQDCDPEALPYDD